MPEGWTRRERYIMFVAAMAAFIVAAVALVGSWKANDHLANSNDHLTAYVQCQSKWNNFLYKVLEVRTESGAEATAAMDELVNAITEAKSADDTRAALAKYKAARANQLATQQQNPLPPPPDEVCTI